MLQNMLDDSTLSDRLGNPEEDLEPDNPDNMDAESMDSEKTEDMSQDGMIGMEGYEKEGDDPLYSPSPDSPTTSPDMMTHDKSLDQLDSPESQESEATPKKKKSKKKTKKEEKDKKERGEEGKGGKDLDNPPSVEEEDSMDSSIDERPDEGAVSGK